MGFCMRFIVPVVGNILVVKKDVFVNVISERRNNIFLEHLFELKADGDSDIVSDRIELSPDGETEKAYLVKIPKGAELYVDRVYIRKGDGSCFNSVTLLSKKEFKHIAKGSRFFISVEDAEKIDFEYGELPSDSEPVVDLRYTHNLYNRKKYLSENGFRDISNEFLIEYMLENVGQYGFIDQKILLSDAAIIRAAGKMYPESVLKAKMDIRFDPEKQRVVFNELAVRSLGLLKDGNKKILEHFNGFCDGMVFPEYVFDKKYSDEISLWFHDSVSEVNSFFGEMNINVESFKFNKESKTLFSGINAIRKDSFSYLLNIINCFAKKARVNNYGYDSDFAIFILFKYLIEVARVIRERFYGASFISLADVPDRLVLSDIGFCIINGVVINLIKSDDNYQILRQFYGNKIDKSIDREMIDRFSDSMNSNFLNYTMEYVNNFENKPLKEEIFDKSMDLFVLNKSTGESILRNVSFFTGGIGVSPEYKGCFEYELNKKFNKIKKSCLRV